MRCDGLNNRDLLRLKLPFLPSRLPKTGPPEGYPQPAQAYCLSDTYDPNNSEQVSIVDMFEYACGMPPLHTNKEMLDVAGQAGFKLKKQFALSTDYTLYYSFVQSPLFVWMLDSRLIDALISLGERVKLLPIKFKKFNDIFLKGTVRAIVKAGELGILSGSNILLFQKSMEN
jgi:hypothetical protein